MRLATVMRLNAASCLGFGAMFVLMPGAVAAGLGSAPAGLVFALGLGLLGNAVLLWRAVRKGRAARRGEVLFFCIGDLGWVLATLVLIGAGLWITAPMGQVLALIVAAGVGAMGLLQWRGLPAA